MVGLVTLVTIRVGSVTSTCLRSSFGDMRTFSGPMVPGSSGTLPGQSSTTSGLSPANAVGAGHSRETKSKQVTMRHAWVLLDEMNRLSHCTHYFTAAIPLRKE